PIPCLYQHSAVSSISWHATWFCRRLFLSTNFFNRPLCIKTREMLLACRFYSLSAQIQRERKNYYQQLEFAQHGSMNDAAWLDWFLGCLERAIESAQEKIFSVLEKSHFWHRWSKTPLNERQTLMLSKLLDGFEGKLKSDNWAKIAKCSHDTALRDIQELIAHGILVKEAAGGRSTSYRLSS
ncbi:MAG: hypothetical protein NT164_06660, partial [Verrucomicrobiae bacterium]|nr:hypothetical protein [Verrucomicrobiae bacterium]